MEGQSKNDDCHQRLSLPAEYISVMFDSLSRATLQQGRPGYSRAVWKHEADRFNHWAIELGFRPPVHGFYRGYPSLDYRLREAAGMEKLNTIERLFRDLQKYLNERKSKMTFFWGHLKSISSPTPRSKSPKSSHLHVHLCWC